MSQAPPTIPPTKDVLPIYSAQAINNKYVSSSSACCFMARGHSLDDIEAESKADCKHCAARKEAIVRLLPDKVSYLASASNITWWAHDITDVANGVDITVADVHWDPESDCVLGIEAFFLQDSTDSDPFCVNYGERGSNLRRLPSQDTSSEASLQFALRCMAVCLKEHADCGNDAEQSLPTRVLYIGTRERPALRLHESRGARSRYACLSYCWGATSKTVPWLQTTTETIEYLRRHIAWDDLPKVFQDAVCFVRRLGIEYIWIDSLCIIQNDGEDKAREIGQMARVYANAIIIIAASSASDPHEGLFSRTSEPYTAKKLSEAVWNPKTSCQGPLYAREALPHVWLDKEGFPLLKRAWAFQERFLSRRVLHFTKEELMWECMKASGCECRIPMWSTQEKKNKIAPHGTGIDRKARDSMWDTAVSLYSSMDMTCNTDTLPGLSGLSSTMQTLYPDQYLAGLWRCSLTSNLLWHRSTPCHGTPEYLAPSWSWASSPVGTHSSFVWCSDFQALAQILDAYCVPTYNTDPTGMVSSGYIKLAAKAAPGKLLLEASEDMKRRRPCDFRGRREYVSVDFNPECGELDVQVVAIGIDNKGYSTLAGKTLHYLILSSNGGCPETYRRRGYAASYVNSKETAVLLSSEDGKVPKECWKLEEIEWWTSNSGDGWAEFTVV